MRAKSQHDVILPVEGNLGKVVLLAMVLTCCVAGCHKRGGREKVSFYKTAWNCFVGGGSPRNAAESVLTVLYEVFL